MEPEKKSNGALVGLVVIIIILVIGGIYMWLSSQNTAYLDESQSGTITNDDATQLNTLDSDSQKTDTSTGVDPNTVY